MKPTQYLGITWLFSYNPLAIVFGELAKEDVYTPAAATTVSDEVLGIWFRNFISSAQIHSTGMLTW